MDVTCDCAVALAGATWFEVGERARRDELGAKNMGNVCGKRRCHGIRLLARTMGAWRANLHMGKGEN